MSKNRFLIFFNKTYHKILCNEIYFEIYEESAPKINKSVKNIRENLLEV